jgi:hypothetical protein
MAFSMSMGEIHSPPLFDDVLEPVGELEVAVGVDGAEVAATPIAVEEPARVLFELVVALDDPRPAWQYLALADAVEGDVVAVLVDQPAVHAGHPGRAAAAPPAGCDLTATWPGCRGEGPSVR